MATGDLVTLAQARDYCGISDAEDTSMNTRLSAFITSVSRLIRVYTGREFSAVAGSVTRSFAYQGGGVLLLDTHTLRSVATLEIDTETDSSSVLTVNEDFYLMPRGGGIDGVYTHIQFVNVAEPDSVKGWREVEITGAWGYATIPTDVEEAALDTINHWYKSLTPAGLDFEDTSPRGMTTLTVKSRQLLSQYRWISFGRRN